MNCELWSFDLLQWYREQINVDAFSDTLHYNRQTDSDEILTENSHRSLRRHSKFFFFFRSIPHLVSKFRILTILCIILDNSTDLALGYSSFFWNVIRRVDVRYEYLQTWSQTNRRTAIWLKFCRCKVLFLSRHRPN